MRDPKALALFQEILKKTEARKLAWETTSQVDEFTASMMGKYHLKLLAYTSLSNWGEREGPPTLALNDEKGNMLVEMNNGIDGISAEDLNKLLTFAHRIAVHADEKIDELLTELQKDEDIAF
jgi:hypothetical protein